MSVARRARLSEQEVAAGISILDSLAFVCDPEECEHLNNDSEGGRCYADEQRKNVVALGTDYLQDREDLQRVAKALKRRIEECEHGPMDASVDSLLDMCNCCGCVSDRALLAEMGL